jgi:hypothetical protein
VAEDETSWWAAQRRLPRPTVEPPLGSWRRTWEQSEPPVEGGPRRGSSIWRG